MKYWRTGVNRQPQKDIALGRGLSHRLPFRTIVGQQQRSLGERYRI